MSRLEGDALIMHVGEKPYVVTTSASMYAFRGPVAWGHVELSSRVLTTDAVVGMLEQLLPIDQRKSLDEYGAIEYGLPETTTFSDSFTVVAARGGDDVWLEIRRTPAALGAVEMPATTPISEVPLVAFEPLLIPVDPPAAAVEPGPLVSGAAPLAAQPDAVVSRLVPEPVSTEPEIGAEAHEPVAEPLPSMVALDGEEEKAGQGRAVRDRRGRAPDRADARRGGCVADRHGRRAHVRGAR
jgi:hypothetical protein